MLTKLMKYDIRSTWRDFAGIYMAILLGVIIVPLLINNFDLPIAGTLAMLIITSIIIGTIVVTIINLFHIFLKNVFTKQGYLTMTLPVSSGQLVFSKLLVSTMWIVLTGIVSVIGLFIFAFIMNPTANIEFTEIISEIHAVLNGQGYLSAALIILMTIASVVKEIAKLFLACSIGHLKQLSRFRVPIGIAAYFACSWLETLLVQGIGKAVSYLPQTGELVRQLNAISDTGQLQDFIGIFNGVLVSGIVFALFAAFAYSAGTVWILNHKLDLD
ncbi:MAG: hypothetical protein K0Q48_170 [Bacillota bacterium]|nr:hypothetical protein [Bacillota bacterium]